jgi:hypothetical protein
LKRDEAWFERNRERLGLRPEIKGGEHLYRKSEVDKARTRLDEEERKMKIIEEELKREGVELERR